MTLKIPITQAEAIHLPLFLPLEVTASILNDLLSEKVTTPMPGVLPVGTEREDLLQETSATMRKSIRTENLTPLITAALSTTETFTEEKDSMIATNGVTNNQTKKDTMITTETTAEITEETTIESMTIETPEKELTQEDQIEIKTETETLIPTEKVQEMHLETRTLTLIRHKKPDTIITTTATLVLLKLLPQEMLIHLNPKQDLVGDRALLLLNEPKNLRASLLNKNRWLRLGRNLCLHLLCLK